MGIALPPWIVEGHNNIWVLGVYGLLLGVGLPILVVRTRSHVQLLLLLTGVCL